MKANIRLGTKHGLEVYTARLLNNQGLIVAQSTFLSEQHARNWLLRTIYTWGGREDMPATAPAA